MPKTFLILGAGMTGLPLAHYVLKHCSAKHDLQVILVSRADEFYWNMGAPRAAIPGQFTDEKGFFSIPKAFEKYNNQNFEFVLGTVRKWDPDASTVTLTSSEGLSHILAYHTLLLATGSDYRSKMPWKLVGTSHETHTALDKLRKEVKEASSIIVAGGGPTGVEFAGELGHEFAKAEKTRRELEKLKIKIISNARITENRTKNGVTILTLTKIDGSTESLATDLFVATWSVTSNTSFAPASLREQNGPLKVTQSLRAPGYDNVFVSGDADNADCYAATIREPQIRYLATAIGQHLDGGMISTYRPESKVGLAASIGPGRGVGQMGSFTMWSFLVWFYKSRHMCTNVALEYVVGNHLILGSF